MSQLLYALMKAASELEMFFNSAERQEYYTKLEPEKECDEPGITAKLVDLIPIQKFWIYHVLYRKMSINCGF